jgi:2,4-dienoyl-CoA reductase-like NADH-dependent reductase (Old Yellow Enzyme family)
MSKLFESNDLNGMTLKNRFVRSATFEAMADENGTCKPELTKLLAELAREEVGLIITGFTFVSLVGRSRPGQTGIHKDELVSPLTELTRAVHKEGGTIVMQIMHAGCNSFSIPEGEYALGPSPRNMPQGCECREMTKAEISETVADFVKAAVRVKASGFDGVQIHGAHGYLLSQFLSPFFNKRTDEYGGSLENRARIVLECLSGIRSAVGNDYPVLIKINSDDYLDGHSIRGGERLPRLDQDKFR